MNGMVKMIQTSQESKDVLDERRLKRARLINESFASTSGRDASMTTSGDDFDAFFQ